MLKHLYIKNFTLIDTLDLELNPGFSVITGETGAGKSIILGAIGLLLGQRADSKTIKQGAEKCVIEAEFDLSRYGLADFFSLNDIDYDEGTCIVRRELTSAGKSRAFVNDTPVPLTLLKELGEQLVDIHSQHQNLLLQTHDFQLNVIDVMGENTSLLADYHQAYIQYQKAVDDLEAMERSIEQSSQQADFLRFQVEELTAAALTDGEQEELEQRSDTMTHAEDIKSALFEADRLLSDDERGAVGSLRTAESALAAISRVLPGAAELAERLSSCYIELKDVAEEVSRRQADIDFDPAELDTVNNRLDRIYELQKKYHTDTIAGLLEQFDMMKQRLNAIDNSDEALEGLKQQVDNRRKMCKDLAAKLTKRRKQASTLVENEMRQMLVPLGMPNVRFQVSLTATDLTRTGTDKVAFLFSANTSTALQPVSQVASGGEIARVMLSLKAMISRAVKLPTIIFDEIDTGVSGQTAEKMALIMQDMGKAERQVISITHLPQIAALGTTHYKVYKEESVHGTVSRMRQLSAEERIIEIAQMLSGSNITGAAMENARQLLKMGN